MRRQDWIKDIRNALKSLDTNTTNDIDEAKRREAVVCNVFGMKQRDDDQYGQCECGRVTLNGHCRQCGG